MTEARMFPYAKQMFAVWLLIFAASFAVAGGLSAQEQAAAQPREALFGDENISVALISDGDPVPGEEWLLALRFTPSGDEWHGYWSNPGDAGVGMQLELSLPDGWAMGEPLYPVPERLIISGLMNHVYSGEHTVLVPISVPQDAVLDGRAPVTGFVEFLACTDRVCVPQDTALFESRTAGDFAKWRTEIAPLLDAKGSFAIAGTSLRIAIPLPAEVGLTDPHIFLSRDGIVQYAASQNFRRDGDMLSAEIPLSDWIEEGEPEGDLSGILSFGNQAGVRFLVGEGDVAFAGEQVATSGSPIIPPLWTLILGALVGGLILNIMPCVFPILSLKAISLARAGESEARARSEGIAYTAGVIIACVGLGALMLALRAAGEQVGWAFQLQSPTVVVILLVLASVITANFMGLFELPSISITRSGEPASAFATGLLAAIAATPCTGPFMAAALGAALLLPAPMALMLFGVLGLGLALPFLLIGFVPALRSRLPKPGAWMERFRRLMAIPMGLTALALVWLIVRMGGQGFALFALVMIFGIILALAVVGRLQRAGKMAWPAFGLVAAPFLIFGGFALPSSFVAQASNVAAQSIHEPLEYSPEALAEARASGQPIFLWFTADWCVTCKLNESSAIDRETTLEAFEAAGVITMVGDWTNKDEAITMFLSEQGVIGVPLYLWYEPGAAAEQLPQILTADMLSERAER
ncbi:MAG: thioredoxin family protein [Erythrobacter sp.]